jgi:hypothetical protein
MSLDKKAILKEIEVLIRSIKVHYDNIENEHRIPTIELELITSKIRKLHEKSIIYNHLHYIEEEQLQSSKRMKFDHMILKHAAEDNMDEEIVMAPKQNEIFKTQIKFEEKIASFDKVAETAPIVENISNDKIEEKIVETPIAVKTETAAANSFKSVKISTKIGINDRFRFIKNLFGGNGASMEEAINKIEMCESTPALDECMRHLKSSHQWNDEDENVQDFMNLVK